MLDEFTPICRSSRTPWNSPSNHHADLFSSDDEFLATSDNELMDEPHGLTPSFERLQAIIGRLEGDLSELPSLSQFNFQANLLPPEISDLPDLSHLSFSFSNNQNLPSEES